MWCLQVGLIKEDVWQFLTQTLFILQVSCTKLVLHVFYKMASFDKCSKYSSWTLPQLKAELKKRNARRSGRKKELVKRYTSIYLIKTDSFSSIPLSFRRKYIWVCVVLRKEFCRIFLSGNSFQYKLLCHLWQIYRTKWPVIEMSRYLMTTYYF